MATTTDKTTDKHQIIATPKDRWSLALFILRKGHTFNTRKDQKILHRAKNALDLHGPIGGYMADKVGLMELAADETPSLFEVNQEVVELFTGLLDKVKEPPIMAHEVAVLEPVMQQLEDRAHAAEVVAANPDAGPLDPKSESWVRIAAPILENPARFVAVLRDLVSKHIPDPTQEPAYAAFRQDFLEESEPPKADKKKVGRLLPEPDQPPS